MSRMSKSWAIGLIFAWGTNLRADDGPFRALGLEEARQAAKKDGKRVVLVDFYTTWCGPCKKLDQTTWKDSGVLDWLAKEAVALKVDAEKDEPLAAKYRVNAYPTLLLLTPDGAELDRLVGYRDPKAFLDDANAALAGNDSLSRARAKLEGDGRDNPMLRMSYADELARKGRYEDALSEYLWCFDHGLEHRRAFQGVRVSFLPGAIVRLAKEHPPALDELRKRRDAAWSAIEAGKADFDAAMGFTALNENLGESGQTLEAYDRIKGDPGADARVRAYLFDQSLAPLLKARRYGDVLAGVDAAAKVRELIARHEKNKAVFPDDAGLRAFMKRQVCLDSARYYEAMVGSGDHAGVAQVATMLADFNAADAYPTLIEAAKRAGDDKAAEALAGEAREAPK